MMINYQKIHADCHAAGLNAGVAAKPTPMMVGTAKSIFSNEIDYTKPTYRVDDGPCGFASINIYPGNSKLANAYKKLGLARKAYGGGVSVSVHEFGQSYERKMAYASAYAAKLSELTGVDRIYADGRLD
jgi:hypothetical protein